MTLTILSVTGGDETSQDDVVKVHSTQLYSNSDALPPLISPSSSTLSQAALRLVRLKRRTWLTPVWIQSHPTTSLLQTLSPYLTFIMTVTRLAQQIGQYNAQ